MNDCQNDRSVADRAGRTGGTAATTYAGLLRRNVKTARARLGINQEALASRMQALGFDVWVRQTVARVEGGKRRLTAEEVFGLAMALRVSVMHLMTPQGYGEMVALPSGVELPIEDVRRLVWWADRLRRTRPRGRGGPGGRGAPRPDWRPRPRYR
jgi:transcriptional regulator with XRE-family HTH domain